MNIIKRILRKIEWIVVGPKRPAQPNPVIAENISSADYWTIHNVTSHNEFSSREDSVSYMNWRFDQYPGYEKLMPCSGFDNKTILDYGCGPGHDVVGFLEHSKPKKILAMDVSSSSLAETKKRIKLHPNNENVECILIKEKEPISIPEKSVDYIHSSGVLHHTPNMEEILSQFHKILKDDGIIRIMVYNYNSIYAHLYVPYYLQMKKGIDKDLPFEDAFRRNTDGPNCPISNCYTPSQYIAICEKAGFKTTFKGASISLHELDMLQYRHEAVANIKLNEKHRNFLKNLTFDSSLHPLYNGSVAGIDAVFELTKKLDK